MIINAEEHFNEIAREYDFWKEKNFYYYQNLIGLYKNLIPGAASVLEIGCGTGDILANLHPKEGKGIDISAEMIAIAKTKYGHCQNLHFAREDIFATDENFPYQFIFLADVLEHVEKLENFILQIGKRTMAGTTLIISVANPIWEPLLLLAEKLGMKMPEGPHERLTIQENERLFKLAGFEIKKKGYRLMIPKKIWGSDWVNARFHRYSYMSWLGFIVYWILKKKPFIC